MGTQKLLAEVQLFALGVVEKGMRVKAAVILLNVSIVKVNTRHILGTVLNGH
jgi:hypothetical protein